MTDAIGFPHAAESCHYYYPDGRPAYEVPGAGGKPVHPDIRHARKLRLRPSVTTVMRVMDKPALTRWKCHQWALAAMTLPRKPNEPDEAYLVRLERDATAWTRQRADEGTAVHKAIEQFIRGEPFDPRYAMHVAAVRRFLGGIKGPFVGDFKTKETLAGVDVNRLFYDEHVMQLAAYRAGLRVGTGNRIEVETAFATDAYGGRVDVQRDGFAPDARLVSIIIGCADATLATRTWEPAEAERGRVMFNLCLRLWEQKNRMEPGAS